MFTEFLHPELVLFGDFNTDQIKCKHEYEIKDGEIIIHQVINRAFFLERSLINSFTKLLQRMNQKQALGQQDEQLYRNKDYYNGRGNQSQDDYQDDNDQYYDEQDRGFQGYFQQDPNPYADQIYGLNMDAQYMPQQLNGVGQPSPKQHNNKKMKELPYILAKKASTKKPVQEEDQQGWITEEEEQYYVNEQLEEAGGNFATQFIPDTVE